MKDARIDLTYKEKDLVLEALHYYRDNVTQPNEECCGLSGHKRKIMNRAISKLQRQWFMKCHLSVGKRCSCSKQG